MDVGIALELYDLESGHPISIADVAAASVRAEELGYASAWVMDHFWMERDGLRRGGHEPLTTLAYLAARTNRIALGTLVLCNSFRHPGQLAREAAAIADASGGRFILGIGAGWSEAEYRAFDFPFDQRVARLEESVEALRRLLHGGRSSLEGRYLKLRDAEVLRTAPPPPIWVGGGGPRMLRLTARAADGWNLVWPGTDVELFSRLLAQLREEIAAAGRGPEDVTVSVGLLTLVADAAGRQEVVRRASRALGRDPDSRVVVGSVDELATLLDRYREAGADHVVLSTAPSPFARFDESMMERAAHAVRLVAAR